MRCPANLLLLLGALACSGDKADSATPAAPVGEPAAQLRVTPEAVDFGTLEVDADGLVEGEVTQLVAMRNVGREPLTLSSALVQGGDGAFSVTTLNETLLAPDARTDLVITLDAVTPGSHAATLAIASDDPGQPLVEVALSATLEDAGGESCPCPDGFTAREDGSECYRATEEPASATGDSWDACPIVPNAAYGRYGARLPDGGNVQSEFWGQSDGVANGRLNDVGVWACDASGGATTGEQPTGAWIGFSVCVDVDTAGDYLLGLGADNRTRLRVDGVEVFSQSEDSTSNFNYWWLNVVTLTAGSHVLEVEGYNTSSIGAFGAELAGPFAADSLGTDTAIEAADYEGRLLWSTADAIGSAFPIGDAVGWTCPDGTTFDRCADEPVCVGEETAACE